MQGCLVLMIPSELSNSFVVFEMIEFCKHVQAAKSRTPVTLPVSLADGRCETVEADSSTTAAEMCRKIAMSIGLKDRFGFAVYISVCDKVCYM